MQRPAGGADAFPASPWPVTDVDAWDGGGLPLSRCGMLRSDDIDRVHSHMSEMFCPHDLQIEGGLPPIAFRHHQVALGGMTFNALDYGNPYGRVVVTIPPMEQIYLVQISLSGEAEITQGNDKFVLRQGELCVLGFDQAVRQTLPKGYKHFTIKIPRVEMERLLAEDLGLRPGDLHFFARPVRLHPEAASFAHMIRTVCDDIDQGHTSFMHPRTCASIEEALERLLLASVPHSHSDVYNRSESSAAPFYVRRAEEYIRAHAHEPVSLGDLIEASGVSARSLHAGFRRFRDVTPMGYLKNYRLSLARAVLKRGLDDGVSVTEAALGSGFNHLSKFARDYFERYGERPSATLRRLR